MADSLVPVVRRLTRAIAVSLRLRPLSIGGSGGAAVTPAPAARPAEAWVRRIGEAPRARTAGTRHAFLAREPQAKAEAVREQGR